MSRNISPKEVKTLFALSGNLCAYPGCNQRLVEPGTPNDDAVVLAKVAHIVADSRQGPRGNSSLSDEDRDKHPNLLLLCGVHHDIIDSQPTTYSVPVLQQMKIDHEYRVRQAFSTAPDEVRTEYKQETVHSSLLPVTHLPAVLFSAPCAFHEGQEDEVRQRISYPKDNDQLVRFILRESKLLTFHNLHDPKGPFSELIDHRSVEDLPTSKVWCDPERTRRYVNLLNRAMFKYTSNLGIRYDPGHRRFFFPVEESGEERAVEYRPLNANKTTRKVAWQPKRKSTGEKRKYWWHLAAGLRFLQVSDKQWCFSLRPERHLTADGVVPLPPKQIGRRVTSVKSKMRNLNYLTEVNFWRDFLSNGSPRIVLNFGDQSAVISTEFLSFGIEWPGVPDDQEPFKNVSYQDNLFTKAEFDHARDGKPMTTDEDEDEDTESE